MLTFTGFSGINNVQPAYRLKDADLVTAADVDIGLTGELSRRAGYTEVSALCHKNLHQSKGFMLATVGGVLTAIWPSGDRHVIHPALGHGRVRYCNLPDGRTSFSNGLIHGMTDGITGADWSIPAPDLAATNAAHGALDPGSYRYHITFVRLADGLEGPATSSDPFDVTLGGVRFEALPERTGYAVNVYLSGKDGEGAYLAGVAMGTEFAFAGRNAELVLPCRTLDLIPVPVGTLTATWRGRILVVQGRVLWATMPGTTHLCQWRDFKQFDADITAVQPVENGVYVGTTGGLIYLGGVQFDGLTYKDTQAGAVVLGSGVIAPGSSIKLGDGSGQGDAMLCIAGGYIVGGFDGGVLSRLTDDRYHTVAAEVSATYREINGIPQYIAVPQ